MIRPIFFFALASLGALVIHAPDSSAQNRSISARQLILDDNAGNQLIIVPPVGLVGTQTYQLPMSPSPAEASGFTRRGTLTGQYLQWDAAYSSGLGAWVPVSGVSALALPFSQTGATALTMFTLINTNAVSGGAGLFVINNAANNGAALAGATNGSGMAVSATTTGTATGLLAQSDAGSTGSAATINSFNVANPSPTLAVSGNGAGQAISGVMTGTGRAGNFVINNAANSNIVVNGFTNGTGVAGNFQISNPANAAPALVAVSNGTGYAFEASGAHGARIATTGASQRALEITAGRIVLSNTSVASGGSLNANFTVNAILSDGVAASQATGALPAAEDGTVMYVTTNDPDGATVTGAIGGAFSFAMGTSVTFVRMMGGWHAEF